MFVSNTGIYTFQAEDRIIKLISNEGNNDVPYAVAYREKNIYYLSDMLEFIPYETITDKDVRKKITEMDKS